MLCYDLCNFRQRRPSLARFFCDRPLDRSPLRISLIILEHYCRIILKLDPLSVLSTVLLLRPHHDRGHNRLSHVWFPVDNRAEHKISNTCRAQSAFHGLERLDTDDSQFSRARIIRRIDHCAMWQTSLRSCIYRFHNFFTTTNFFVLLKGRHSCTSTMSPSTTPMQSGQCALIRVRRFSYLSNFGRYFFRSHSIVAVFAIFVAITLPTKVRPRVAMLPCCLQFLSVHFI